MNWATHPGRVAAYQRLDDQVRSATARYRDAYSGLSNYQLRKEHERLSQRWDRLTLDYERDEMSTLQYEAAIAPLFARLTLCQQALGG